MKILVVGNCLNLVSSLETCLTVAGYDVLTADNVVVALGVVLGERPDLVIQELDDHGPDCCWRIRSVSNVPLIALCSGSEEDRIKALYRGADICLAMPFDYELLLAHSRALLRRHDVQYLPSNGSLKTG